MKTPIIVCLLLGSLIPSLASVREINVATAASVKFAMEELVGAFRKENPDILPRPTYGSSGNFFSQIQNGAPFDLFFSADLDYPNRIVEAKLSADGEVFTYALGSLVLWVPSGLALDPSVLKAESLTHPTIRKIAIANPELAPYGRAALATLQSLGIHETVKSKLVLGENINQTAQFVQSGAADIGFIAHSLAAVPPLAGKGKYWEVPQELHPAIRQGGVLLKNTREAEAAKRFRDFILGERGRAILLQTGFCVPPGGK